MTIRDFWGYSMPAATHDLPAPTFDSDLFAEAALLEPYDHYRTLRDLGPVVWLSHQGLYALGRYQDVRSVLGDHERFISSEGVAISESLNKTVRGNTLTTDPPIHDHLRSLVAGPLRPRALREEAARVQAVAKRVVGEALRHEVVDAVPTIARAIPLAVVPDFLGFPEDCRPLILDWVDAAGDAVGPSNERGSKQAAAFDEFTKYLESVVKERRLLPGTLGAELLAAADRGAISIDQCPTLLLDYFAPSMGTTISALSATLALFATNPEQWDLLRAEPERASRAFNEAIRLESPIRGFTRVTSGPVEVGGTRIPAGSRVLVLFGSANRDERKWERPDAFDITRDNTDHVALGYGIHSCAGQGLARMEVVALLTELARSVTRLELAGEPRWLTNSTHRSYASLPLRLHAGVQTGRDSRS